jgi:hypothetical protein
VSKAITYWVIVGVAALAFLVSIISVSTIDTKGSAKVKDSVMKSAFIKK